MTRAAKHSLRGTSPAQICRRFCPEPRLARPHHIHRLAAAPRQSLLKPIRWQSRQFSSSHAWRDAESAFQQAPPPPPPTPKKSTRSVLLLTTLLVAGVAVYWATAGDSPGSFDENGQRRHAAGGTGLNATTFVPFEIVAREDVSPTAFVLTLRLPGGSEVSDAARTATWDAVAAAWRHGLWSVEVKQPQLQIARDYTPLPRLVGSNDKEQLRLFVRVVPGGEVSKYLARRPVGSTVDVRGPRLSFDVAARLGDATGVVVLAGGTGVATALQAADAVLQTSATARVSILWANRQADDSIGLDGRRPTAEDNAIVRDIRALQTRYGAESLRVHSFVDAEQTMITESAVRRSIQGSSDDSRGGRLWCWPWRRAAPEKTVFAQQGPTDPACVFHSARVLERLDADVAQGSATARACTCASTGPTGGRGGKNLVLVSGPDGFISAWAGAKMWIGGQERQGPVGGMLGHMAARDPLTFGSWQVLKL